MVQPLTSASRRRAPGERGFTIIEVLIAMSVLLAGMAGILTLQMSGLRATSYSRHATEAAMLGEAKMEWLFTAPAAALAGGSDQVDARGVADPSGLYAREWSVTPDAAGAILEVSVAWLERGGEPHRIEMSSRRSE